MRGVLVMRSIQGKIYAIIFVFTFLPLLVLPAQGYLIPTEWIGEIDYYSFQVDQDTTAEIVVVVLQSLSGHGITDGDGDEISDIVPLESTFSMSCL